MADEQILDNTNTENANDDLGKQESQEQEGSKTLTQDELNTLLAQARKEGETSGYVKGKTDTNARWEKKNAEAIKLAKEDAEKQAKFEKMSDLQKAETERDGYKKELQTLRDELALNEQREETRKLMKDKNLPDSFLDAVLVFKDAEATLAKIDEFKILFDAEVQKAVEARISTHTPKQNTVQPNQGIDMNAYRERMLSH